MNKIKTFKFNKAINLYCFTDVHIGHKGHDKMLFNEAIKRLKKDPNGYCFFNGDNIDFTPPGYHSAECEQEKDVNEQLAEFIQLFKDLGKKVLFFRLGNHESRAANLCGVDLGKLIEKNTKVPLIHEGYEAVFIYIGKKKYTVVSSHGEGGNSKTILKRMQLTFPGGDMYFVGHTHELVDYSSYVQIRTDTGYEVNSEFIELAGGSFLGSAEYARKRNMQPTRTGCFIVEFTKDDIYPTQFSLRDLKRK